MFSEAYVCSQGGGEGKGRQYFQKRLSVHRFIGGGQGKVMFSEASVCSQAGGYDVTSCLVPSSFQGVWCHFLYGTIFLPGGMVSLPVWYHLTSGGPPSREGRWWRPLGLTSCGATAMHSCFKSFRDGTNTSQKNLLLRGICPDNLLFMCNVFSRQYVLGYNKRVHCRNVTWGSYYLGFSSHQPWRQLWRRAGSIHGSSQWLLHVSINYCQHFITTVIQTFRVVFLRMQKVRFNSWTERTI